jgi:hypothetical protein
MTTAERPDAVAPCVLELPATATAPVFHAAARPAKIETMTPGETDDLAAVLAAALADAGGTFDDLTAIEAIELAGGLRAIVAALPTPTPRDVHLAATVVAAADLIERLVGN